MNLLDALRPRSSLWLLSGGLGVAALLLYFGLPGRRPPTQSVLFFFGLLMVTLAVARALHVDALLREVSARQRLIDELSAARAELAAGERRAGVLEERQRLARDIHDTLAQGLTGIILHLQTAEEALPAELATARRHLLQAQDAARTSLEEARRFLLALRPEALAQAALPDAIARVARRFGEDTGLAMTVSVAPLPPLRPEAEVTLLRATQEALANARQHAAARHIQVRLLTRGGQAVLEVQDDGRGLVSADRHPAGSGLGLSGLRERVAELGGVLTLDSQPGAGVMLRIALPVAGPS